jgi:VWFA-related protein
MQLSTPSRIVLFLISLLLALALSFLPADAADDSGYRIQESVKEVRMVFSACDRQGRAVPSLRSSDVAVADNGWIIRHFRSFRAAAETPLDLVLLLDVSGSVTSQLPGEIDATKNFLANSHWQERDRVSILVFGGAHPQLICLRDCRAAEAQSKLSSLRGGDMTPLYDALRAGVEILAGDHDPESRPAMILFSDGMDTSSLESLGDALRAAEDLQAAIYTVDSRSGKSARAEGTTVLGYLAASTGGLCFEPGQNVMSALRAVLEDLRSGYVLTYEPPEQRVGEHSVQILPTADPELQFRSRQSYQEPSDE